MPPNLSPLERMILTEMTRLASTRNLLKMLQDLNIAYCNGWNALNRLERRGLVRTRHKGKAHPIEIEIVKEKQKQ